jgi:stringent starvation protein B
VPVQNVLAIYANENGQGMAFDVSTTAAEMSAPDADASAPATAPALSAVPDSSPDTVPAEASSAPNNGGDEPPKKGGRPTLTRIK